MTTMTIMRKKAMTIKARIRITIKKKKETTEESPMTLQRKMDLMKEMCLMMTKAKPMNPRRKNMIRNSPLHRNNRVCPSRLPQLLAKILQKNPEYLKMSVCHWRSRG